MSKQICRNRRLTQHISFTCLDIDQHIADIIARHYKRTIVYIEAANFAEAPTPHIGLITRRMIQYVGDLLLPIINENEFVVVPAHGQVLLRFVLDDTIDELLRLVGDVPERQRNLQSFLIVVHLDEVDTRI